MSPPTRQQIRKLLLQTCKATCEDNSRAKNMQAGREQVPRKASVPTHVTGSPGRRCVCARACACVCVTHVGHLVSCHFMGVLELNSACESCMSIPLLGPLYWSNFYIWFYSATFRAQKDKLSRLGSPPYPSCGHIQ